MKLRRIIDIGPDDAFVDDKERFIGQLIIVADPTDIEFSVHSDGWESGRCFPVAKNDIGLFFHQVKTEEVKDERRTI